MITQYQLQECLKLLGDAYGYEFPVFKNPTIFGIWFDFFSQRFGSSDKFNKMVCNYIANNSYFPRSPKELYESWNENTPALINNGNSALPSSEINVQALTPEQMAENYLRMKLIIKVAMGKGKLLSADKRDELIRTMQAMHIDDLKEFVDNYKVNKI